MRGNNNLILNNRFYYAVGLFTADGCLSKDKRHLEICSKDYEQIKNFALCLNLTNKITGKSRGVNQDKRYFHIQFSNVKLYKLLEKIGLRQRKSLTINKLTIPNEFFIDFLRGYLDGDGSIQIIKHPASKRHQLKVRYYSGSDKYLRWLKNTITNIFQVYGGFLQKLNRVWCLTYCKRDGIDILKKIYYPNAICLSRKRLLAEKILQTDSDFLKDRWHNRYTKK